MHGDVVHIITAVGGAGTQVIGINIAVLPGKINARSHIIVIYIKTGDAFAGICHIATLLVSIFSLLYPIALMLSSREKQNEFFVFCRNI